jgi:para-aminobenzoate synthetase / 4-amino-4-deoxychorismate lyase
MVRRVLSPRSLHVSAPGVRCWRVPLKGGLTLERAVLWLCGDRRPFAFVGDWLGGLCVLGSEPVRVVNAGKDPFAVLDVASLAAAPAARDGEAVVGGGWVGWLGYGLGARVENLPPGPPARDPRPPHSLAFHDHVVVYEDGSWWFEALWRPERDARLRERLAIWQRRLRSEPPPTGETAPGPFSLCANGARGHLAAVAACRERIAAGDLFQANLCLRLEGAMRGDPVELFSRALPRAKPRFGALVDGAVSLSPERFLRRQGAAVTSEPIKGTRPRAGAEDERQSARAALIDSAKDAAEHVMIVDLMRSDIGRVCEYGSIRVEPPRVEGHSGVWHLVSSISGRLREGVGDGALLRASFPPGSVTGAPKVQAMKLIAALEATRRELYTGAVGILSPLAGLDLSVAIRTFEIGGGRIWLGVGGGIVADSDPELELAEALAKAAGPLAAIGADLAPRVARTTPPPARAAIPPALRHGTRPDQELGVFETVLVQGGLPVELVHHTTRLAASLAILYGSRPPADLTARVCAVAATAPTPLARLRILAEPDGTVTISVGPADRRSRAGEPPLRLVPFMLAGGLGAHKWRDRRLLEALAAKTPGTVPLLVDSDGLVLEAAHANVWIAEHGRLLTPLADGRILPGVTRASLLTHDESARAEPLELSRLAHAGKLFLTSSIAGRRSAVLAS